MEHYRLCLKKAPQIYTEKYTANALAASASACCAAFDRRGRLFVGAEKGVLFFENGRFVRISGLHETVSALCALPSGDMAAAAGNRIYLIQNDRLSLLQTLEREVLSLKSAGENAYALTSEMLYKFNGEAFAPEEEVPFGTGRCMAPTPGKSVYVASDRAVSRLMAKRTRFGVMSNAMTHTPKVLFHAMEADDTGAVWCGAEDGVWVFDGRSEWVAPKELPQFPACRITALSFGKNRFYVGTQFGLYIVSGENTRFYGAGRYLPGARVNAVLPAEDESEVWVCCEGGVSRLRFAPMSLEEKAAYYEDLIPYFKREGYLTRRYGMTGGDYGTGRVSVTDNDGLYTADYVAYQSMKYALTGEEAARENARGSMNALLKLHAVTGIPGFPARAYRRPGEDAFGNGNPEWHLTADGTGPLEWKGETSSDELVGHYFAAGWYYDLCADETEKQTLSQAFAAVTEHILTHGYTLCDADGAPTSWAHFGPEDLNRDDAWCWEKGVNALELLNFLRLTYHMTGDKKYLDVQKEMICEHHYAMNMLAYKKDDAHSSVIDDRLTMYAVTHLLRLETDETLLRYVRLGLRRHYEYIKENHMPYYAFIFALANGGHTDTDEAVRVMEEYPLDLRYYKMTNAGRPDVAMEERVAQFGETEHLRDPLPASERVTGEMHSTARAVGSRYEGGAMSPCSWLLSYWFGRYLGILS